MSEAQCRETLGDAVVGRRAESLPLTGKERDRNQAVERMMTSSNEGLNHDRMLKGLTSFTLSLCLEALIVAR